MTRRKCVVVGTNNEYSSMNILGHEWKFDKLFSNKILDSVQDQHQISCEIEIPFDSTTEPFRSKQVQQNSKTSHREPPTTTSTMGDNFLLGSVQSNSSNNSYEDYDDGSEILGNLSSPSKTDSRSEDSNSNHHDMGTDHGQPSSSSSRKRKKSEKILSDTQKMGRFTCSECGRGFSQKGNLQIHYRIHTGERPYKCDARGCNKAFVQSSQLLQHKRVHLDIKPFACPVEGCVEKFRQLSNVQYHMSRKHGLVKAKKRNSTDED